MDVPLPRNRFTLWIGIFSSAIFLFTALLGGWVFPLNPDGVSADERLLPPSAEHFLGTDAFGRDQFSRVVAGARLDLVMIAIALSVAALPGVGLGLLAGYEQGWLDFLLGRGMEIWLSLPSLLVAVVILAAFGASLQNLALALGVAGVPSFFRMARSGAISLRKQAYIEAARALGAGRLWLLWKHILPNMLSPLIVLASARMGGVLLAGSSLSFIGLGAQPPQAEWGALLAAGKDSLDSAWWLAFYPGLALTVTAWGFQLLGDGLRDSLAQKQG